MVRSLSRDTDTKLNRRRSRNAKAEGSQSKPRRRLAPATRRAELLATALSIFARRGIGRATHAEVATDAGCSLATTFVYFPTRDDLLSAVLSEVERFYTDMVAAEHRRDVTADDAIRNQFEAFSNSVSVHPDYARIWLEWSTAIREDIWPRYLTFQERVVAELSSTIERGKAEGAIVADIDGDDAARLMIGAATMLVQMKFSGQADEKIAHFVRTMMAAAFGIR